MTNDHFVSNCTLYNIGVSKQKGKKIQWKGNKLQLCFIENMIEGKTAKECFRLVQKVILVHVVLGLFSLKDLEQQNSHIA
jgi:hypothetical protein